MTNTTEQFSPDESQLLAPFLTNLDRPIFGLRNLPEVVRGALFSRYSRTEKSLRRVLLDEFLTNEEGLGNISAPNEPANVDKERAEAFYDRVLVGYGDDSVAELAGAHLACENISSIAAKVIEDSRLGISPLEKSKRYVAFNKKVNGRYRYYRDPIIMQSSYGERYEKSLDHLFDTFTTILDPMIGWVQQNNPRDGTTTDRAYQSATRAKAFDLLRGIFPMSLQTNVGLYGNGRSFEYLLTKMAASPLTEVRELGQSMQRELDLMIPSFVKRAKNERGAAYANYLASTRERTAEVAKQLPPINSEADEPGVRLVSYDPAAELKVIASILYPHCDEPLESLQAYARTLSSDERAAIIATYVGEREVRFHKPGRALEEPVYQFDILADIASFYDLHRHRVLTQQRQSYGVQHGYVVPPEVVEAGMGAQFCATLEQAAETVEIISREFPHQAQYAVPFGFRIRWQFTTNLRELYHLTELRSSRQGHPNYRRLAQEIFKAVQAVHPALAAGMRFVDLNDYSLERLEAEKRLDAKMQQR